MFELFLFIDPLCKSCRNSEDTVLKLSEHINSKFKLQFIPIYNLKVIQTDFCNSNNQLKKKLSPEKLATLYDDVILDYKAALFQGMKKGRNYLVNMQDKILYENFKYSNHLAIDIAKKCKLDVDMFQEDRRSSLARDSIEKDQELVQSMNINRPASAVIFNYNDTTKDGILTTDIEYYNLLNACSSNFTTNNIQHALRTNQLKHSKKAHLRIVK